MRKTGGLSLSLNYLYLLLEYSTSMSTSRRNMLATGQTVPSVTSSESNKISKFVHSLFDCG